PSAAQLRSLTTSFINSNDGYLCSPYFFEVAEKIEGFADVSVDHLDEMLARHDRYEQTKIKRANEADTGQDVPNGDKVDLDISVPVLQQIAGRATSGGAMAGTPDGDKEHSRQKKPRKQSTRAKPTRKTQARKR
ncbi:hypothetical protein, partial [Ralstonia solanacearum]|uniref:hypothetical protein n=1 Tax=Ralstonia solanacearum TaxID=305 RepID=UPI00168AE94E